MKHSPCLRQQGIALLSTLLALTLMTLLISELTFSFRAQLRRTESLQQLDQARWYATSTEDLARKVLKQDFKDNSEVTHNDQNWAKQNVVFPVTNGKIAGKIRDMQGCFNLNALAKPVEEGKPAVELDAFRQLLEYLNIDDTRTIANATRNWVTERTATGAGANDADYLALPVPYLASHTLMRDASEWRAVSGVTPAIARKVLPYLCAIPISELQLNVNTIPADQPELLAALYDQNLPVEQARSILENRPKKGWSDVQDFTSQSLLANFSNTSASKMMAVVSYYFEVDTLAQFNDAEMRLRSLLIRNKEDELSVIRRKFGGVS
ncbi:type II secretion system minor pseudopilin GspK [Endozoicomonas sp. Mp262]|uniref:type II secretion system minor pseudopilin GspK n=1 Tax=Endozoicomonas sp. Mp262 TaxID=2919499 RepID=UPI0021D83013